MLKFRVTIVRVYEADIDALDYVAAQEIAQELVDCHHELLVVDTDIEVVELTSKLSAELKRA